MSMPMALNTVACHITLQQLYRPSQILVIGEEREKGGRRGWGVGPS